ncbi:MAG: hypothetical protein JRH20_24175 [Deltaproteobacteria bacterium]|nr:hypothetical protein [Deltaproteobacteria bacterium]
MALSSGLRRASILVGFLLLVGCPKSEQTGPPEGCSYSVAYGCWACDGSRFGQRYARGCRRTNDCAIFCGEFPDGFEVCTSSRPDSPCTDQLLPRGLFEVCRVITYVRLPEEPNAYLPVVVCPFCGWDGGYGDRSLAMAPDGNCYFITCEPEDIQSDHVPPGACPNLTPLADGGMPDVAWPWDMGVPTTTDLPTGKLDGGI